MNDMIVISVVNCSNPNDPEKFLAFDHGSSGHYWTNSISSAVIFKTEGDARFVLDGPDFNREWFNGPPMMIHSGLGLCNKRKAATGTFAIKRIKFDVIDSETVTGAID